MAPGVRGLLLIASILVGIRRYAGQSPDAHGNLRDTWGSPEPALVYGFYPRTVSEPLPERTLTAGEWSLLAPPDIEIGPHDVVEFEGVPYEVVGDPKDYRHGPFGWNVGYEIFLTKVEG